MCKCEKPENNVWELWLPTTGSGDLTQVTGLYLLNHPAGPCTSNVRTVSEHCSTSVAQADLELGPPAPTI